MAFVKTIKREVITKFDADGRKHRSEVDKIKRAEGDLEKERAKNHEKQRNRSKEGDIFILNYKSGLEKLTSHFAALEKIGTFTWDSITKAGANATGSAQKNFQTMQRAGESFASALGQVQRGLGNVLIALAPVVAKLSDTAGFVADIFAVAAGEWADPNMSREERAARKLANDARRKKYADEQAAFTQSFAGQTAISATSMVQGHRNLSYFPGMLDVAQEQYGAISRAQFNAQIAAESTPWARLKAGATAFLNDAQLSRNAWGDVDTAEKFGTAAARTFAQELLRVRGGAEYGASAGFGAYGGASGLGIEALGVDVRGIDLGALASKKEREFLTQSWKDRLGYEQFNAGRSESRLESMFGPIDEFSAYGKAFEMLGGAVSSAMTAWIDGSMGATKAIKAFLGEAIKGLAVEMAMQALKHGAYAIGSLAFGNVTGAVTHGKAAAAFAAGSIAAAVAAKQFGGGGSGAPPSAAAAPPVGGAGGYGSQQQYQGTHQTIFINDAFGETSTRERIQQFKRRQEEAYGAPGVLNS